MVYNVTNSSKRLLSADHHNSGSHDEVEVDNPPVLLLTVLGVLLAIVIVGVGFASKQVIWKMFSDQVYDVDLSQESQELKEYRSRDQARLTQYDVVDEAKGYYQVPIEEAIDAFVKTQQSQPTSK